MNIIYNIAGGDTLLGFCHWDLGFFILCVSVVNNYVSFCTKSRIPYQSFK